MEKRFWGGPRPGSVFRIVTPMLILFYFAAILTVDHEPARADSRRALLMPGKKTLYQRVITHPGAHLYEGASTASAVRKGWIRPFTAYYVFATSQTDATQWLEVGLASSGTPDGWIEAGKTSPWLQALTLKFTERTGRQPVLFFKDMVDLEAVAADRDPAGRYLDLMTRFSDFQSGDESGCFRVSPCRYGTEVGGRVQGSILPHADLSGGGVVRRSEIPPGRLHRPGFR